MRAQFIACDFKFGLIGLLRIASFQKQDFKHLTFPAKLYVDYVRVYQEESVRNGVTCDPPSHPTSDYINK